MIEATVTDAVEDSGRSRALVTPLTLTLSKSTPRLLYPIYYIQVSGATQVHAPSVDEESNFLWGWEESQCSAL